MPREGAVSRDGRGETLSGMIVMLKGANGKDVVTAVQQRLEQIRPLLPHGATIRPFYNQGDVVDHTTHTVFRNLLEGGLLVTLILFIFLRNIRASLITASVIPLSLLFAFVAMKQFGVSANLMSLGALDFGLIVDASVVMVENFVRRLEHAERPHAGPPAFAHPGSGVRSGTADRVRRVHHHRGVSPDLHARRARGTHVHADGVHGVRGGPGIAAARAHLRADDVLVPLLRHVTEKPSRWFDVVRRVYRRHLGWALGHRALVVGGAAAFLIAALASVPYLGTEFMPQGSMKARC